MKIFFVCFFTRFIHAHGLKGMFLHDDCDKKNSLGTCQGGGGATNVCVCVCMCVCVGGGHMNFDVARMGSPLTLTSQQGGGHV